MSVFAFFLILISTFAGCVYLAIFHPVGLLIAICAGNILFVACRILATRD
jgi:predicted exporter